MVYVGGAAPPVRHLVDNRRLEDETCTGADSAGKGSEHEPPC
jgi:hypothetical protein